jgi:hypothetical protein
MGIGGEGISLLVDTGGSALPRLFHCALLIENDLQTEPFAKFLLIQQEASGHDFNFASGYSANTRATGKT